MIAEYDAVYSQLLKQPFNEQRDLLNFNIWTVEGGVSPEDHDAVD